MRAGPKNTSRWPIAKLVSAAFAVAVLLIGAAAQEKPAKPAPPVNDIQFRFAFGGNVAIVRPATGTTLNLGQFAGWTRYAP